MDNSIRKTDTNSVFKCSGMLHWPFVIYSPKVHQWMLRKRGKSCFLTPVVREYNLFFFFYTIPSIRQKFQWITSSSIHMNCYF